MSGKVSLQFIWQLRLRFRAEGNKLRAEGDKLRAEGNKLWAEGDKLWAEGNKLRAEGDKLRAEGNKLWAEGVIAAYGNVIIKWEYRETSADYACVVEGEVFEPEVKK